jgi:hypoxanthine phosphoribosyltransferase
MFDLEGKKLRVMHSAEAIARRVAELGAQITRDYQDRGKDLVLVGVMKGSVIFLADLCRAIDLPCTFELIGIASYGDETKSSGVVQITHDLTRPIDGKHVVVVEDIVDTGLTIHYLLDNFRTRNPKSLKVAALLHKPERSIQQVPIDYLGFTIPNQFVVGYGLDYAQRYRNLPFIGVVEGTGE